MQAETQHDRAKARQDALYGKQTRTNQFATVKDRDRWIDGEIDSVQATVKGKKAQKKGLLAEIKKAKETVAGQSSRFQSTFVRIPSKVSSRTTADLHQPQPFRAAAAVCRRPLGRRGGAERPKTDHFGICTLVMTSILQASPFSKVRMTGFPKWYPFTHHEPRFYPFMGTFSAGDSA